MTTQFQIKSSDGALLEKATRIAKEFAGKYSNDQVVGIVFLGAIVRGYFDNSADIDVAIFKKRGSDIRLDEKYLKVEGVEVHAWLSDYEDELSAEWDMARRWAFSNREIFHDPEGKISRLLEEKVPLKPDERKWLLMSGLALSEWYVNRLSQLWVERGSLLSAHEMFEAGISHFFDMLFGLNNELVPALKWRYYCAERLARIPVKFQEHVIETMLLQSISVEELERRQKAFMEMWREMLPIVEGELQMSFEEINALV